MSFGNVEACLFATSLPQVPYDGGMGLLEENSPFSGGFDRKGLAEAQGEDLPVILGALTRELCGQVQLLQSLGRLTAETPDGAGVERKLVQADAKTQIEAISLIVRTLEKIDSLQRALAEARSDRDAAQGEADYQTLLKFFEERVDARVKEKTGRRTTRKRNVTASGATPRAAPPKRAPRAAPVERTPIEDVPD